MEPLVTLVTPSYNQGRFIRATIESVLSQDYPNLEYIVMDGGSTDETASIVKDYTSRLTWLSEKDRGQSHAINKGFRAARGEIVSWLNSDDLILPGAIRHAANALREHPDTGAVYGEGYLIDEAGHMTGRFPWTEPFNLWKLVYLSDYILQQTVYFRRNVIEELGYLREDLHYVMDWDILIRIGKRYPLHYIPQYMGCLREYPSAKSFSGGAKRVQEIAKVLQEHTGLRVPPGYVYYGLETYRNIWESRVPLKFTKRLIRVACGYWIERTLHGSQGWYPDLSAGKTVKYMLPSAGQRTLVLAGSNPSRQKLTIFADGNRIAQRSFESGEFEWSVPIAEAAQPVNLLFKASRPYVLRSVRTEALAESRRHETETAAI